MVPHFLNYSLISIMSTRTIHEACLVNDWELCIDLLEADSALVDDVDSYGRSPLHICAAYGSDEACAVLIEYGARMDLPEYESGYTPLHTSLYFRHLKITLLLLKAGADIGDRVAHAYMNESSEKEDCRIHTDVCCKRDKYRSIRDVLAWKKNVDHEGLSPLDLLSTILTPSLKRAKRALNCTSIVTFGKADYPLGVELPNLKSHVYKPKTIDTLSEIQESDIVKVAASKFMSAALTKDGAVYTWGYGKGGRLGHGDITVNTGNTSTAIPFPRQVIALKGHIVTGIALAESHVLAVTHGGSVFAWGSNKYGQLGLGTNISNTGTIYTNPNGNSGDKAKDDEDTSTTSAVGEGSMCSEPCQIYSLKKQRIIGIAAGDNHSVAFNDNGEVWCWGSNSKGQLGLKPTANSNSTQNMVVYTPKQLHIGNKSNKAACQPILQVSAGPYSTLILRKIRDETEIEHNINRGYSERQPLKSISEVYQFGYGNPIPTRVNFSNNSHRSKELTEPTPNKYGYITSIQPCATNHAVNIIQVSAGKYHNVALSSASLVYTWGLNADMLGHTTRVGMSTSGEQITTPVNPSRNITSPRVVQGLLTENGGGPIKYVCAAGGNRTCAISESGDLYTWGATSITQQGVLGHGKGSSYAPVPKRVMGVKRAVQVACGENHTLVLLSAAMPPLPLDDIVTTTTSTKNDGKSTDMAYSSNTNSKGNRYSDKSRRRRSNSQFDDLESDHDSDSDHELHSTIMNDASFEGEVFNGTIADDHRDDGNDDGETYSTVCSLKNLCERKLAKSISLQTAIPLLAIAERADASHLLNFATNFIDMNLDAILMHARQADLDCLIEGYDSVCNHYKRTLSMENGSIDFSYMDNNGQSTETPKHHYQPPVNGERIRRKSSGSFGSFNDLLALNGRETPTKESLPTDLAIGTGGDDKEEDGADSAGGKALHDDKDLLRLPPKTGATSAGLDSVNGVKKRIRALKKKLTVIEAIEGKMITSKKSSPPTIPCIPETTMSDTEGEDCKNNVLSKEQLEKVSKKGLFQGELKRLALILTRLEAEEVVRGKAQALRAAGDTKSVKQVKSPSRAGKGGKVPSSPSRSTKLTSSPKALRRAVPPSFEEWGAMLAAPTTSNANTNNNNKKNRCDKKPVNVWSARMKPFPPTDVSNTTGSRSLSSSNADGSTVLSPCESPVLSQRKGSASSSCSSNMSNEEMSRSFEVVQSSVDGRRGPSIVETELTTKNSIVIPMRQPSTSEVHNSTTGAVSHLPDALTIPAQTKSKTIGYNISSFLVLGKGNNGQETIKGTVKTPQKAPEPVCPWRTPNSGGKTDREGSIGGSFGETPGPPIRMMDIEAEESARMSAALAPSTGSQGSRGGGKAWFIADSTQVASVDTLFRQEEEEAELAESLRLIEQMEAQEREMARMEAMRIANCKSKGKKDRRSNSQTSPGNGRNSPEKAFGNEASQSRKGKKGGKGGGEKKKNATASSSSGKKGKGSGPIEGHVSSTVTSTSNESLNVNAAVFVPGQSF